MPWNTSEQRVENFRADPSISGKPMTESPFDARWKSYHSGCHRSRGLGHYK